MKIVIAHPTGNAFVRAACSGFVKSGILSRFYTSIASFQGDILDRFSMLGPFSEIRRRQYDRSLKPFTQVWPWYEIGRFTAAKVGLQSLIKHEAGLFSVDSVYQNFDKRVASLLASSSETETTAVYAYEDGALATFQAAKSLGLQCFYDLPIGYWRSARRLLIEERERWPDWAVTITGYNDSDAKLSRKDEELMLADHIIVASQFTAKTLADFPGTLGPIHIVPYGFPPVVENHTLTKKWSNRPLKLLFVGGLSQRKGIANLFSAVDYLGHHVELTVVGYKASHQCPALDQALAKHRWIPSLPHEQVLQLMREHDVLVFPSLFEGFGLVITEAMSQGVPVITTERTAGPDLIKHDENGWLVEAGSTEALILMIEELCQSPNLIKKVGNEALQTARLRPWSVYEQELVDIITAKK